MSNYICCVRLLFSKTLRSIKLRHRRWRRLIIQPFISLMFRVYYANRDWRCLFVFFFNHEIHAGDWCGGLCLAQRSLSRCCDGGDAPPFRPEHHPGASHFLRREAAPFLLLQSAKSDTTSVTWPPRLYGSHVLQTRRPLAATNRFTT